MERWALSSGALSQSCGCRAELRTEAGAGDAAPPAPLPLMGRTRLPPRGTGLAPRSLRCPRPPRRGGRGNLGEVKAASARLRLRPRRSGHWGIGSAGGDEEMEPRCAGSRRGHGAGGEGICSQDECGGVGVTECPQTRAGPPAAQPQRVPGQPSKTNWTSSSRAPSGDGAGGVQSLGGLWGDRDPLWGHGVARRQTLPRAEYLREEPRAEAQP